MKKRFLALSTGFALFSMFFGSGNLVFPVAVGQESGGHFLLAALGILSTGVIVPFLGVLGMLLYRGNIQDFFQCFGKKGIFIFSLLSLALMGPFGVLARCITVVHGALLLLIPNASLPIVSLIMCVLIFVLTVNKNKIVPVLGTILTPLLLVAIGAIAFFGMKDGIRFEATELSSFDSFKNGFFQGYQTMDLLAAFFFSTFVISHLQKANASSPDEASSLKVFFKAAIIGAGILSSVYVVLVLLGWIYAPDLLHVRPQEMLGVIALKSLGSFAAPCVCLAVIFACLTTAIVLASLFAEFLRKEIAREKIGNKWALIITLAIGFTVSTLEFSGIARFLGPILEIIYPALIALTVVNIGNRYIGMKSSHWPFTLAIAAKLFFFR